jgi:hypothetical protein
MKRKSNSAAGRGLPSQGEQGSRYQLDPYRRYGNRRQLSVEPNLYHNTPFPTPLEARWARFFDLLQVRWAYNPRIDQLGKPLPFWLAFAEGMQCHYKAGFPEERGMWMAISASEPDAATKLRLRNLASVSQHWVHLLVGEPQPGFGVWSWRLSRHTTIDGRYGVADLQLNWMCPENFPTVPEGCSAAFDTDFNRTIGRDGHTTIERAFQAMGP